MELILFGILGAILDPDWVYWVIFGILCAYRFVKWFTTTEIVSLEDGER